jgi:hypothetical protein|tara:strand:- start:1662 stop:1883 length:222 start_codon:yes stop_codon:yes gene_type:complete
MKTKTDERVAKYCHVQVPITQHRKLKARAKKRGMRLNAYIPKLLNVAIKDENCRMAMEVWNELYELDKNEHGN